MANVQLAKVLLAKFGNPKHSREELEPEWQEDPLTILNDDYKLGFPAIADAIERTYLADSLAGQPA